MSRLHTPFDAVELASDAVARGNRKVFEEIGYEFARYLESRRPRRRSSPACATATRRTGSAAARRLHPLRAGGRAPQAMLLANLEIGLHEQTRLQPEIREAMDAAYTTKEDLGRRLCPNAPPRVRRAAATLAAPAQRALDALARELITRSLMVLSVPGRILALGTALDDPYPESLRELTNAELAALVARFEAQPPVTEDWSVFEQRMRYIVHLFRCFQEQRDLFDPPFTHRAGRAVPGREDPGRGPLRCSSKKRRIRPHASSADGCVVADPRDAQDGFSGPLLWRPMKEWPAPGYSLTSCATPARSSAASTFAAAPGSSQSRPP